KYEAQKIAVEASRQEYEKMIEKYGEGSRQAQNAASRYNNEVSSLNNLERHISSVTKEMQEFQRQQDIQGSKWYKAGDALQNFGDKLGSISGKAREVGGALTKSITLPAMGVIGAVGG